MLQIEEGLGEEEVEYQNFNIRDASYIWVLCNKAEERQKIKEFLIPKEYTLAVETDRKRFFGKFAQKEEKETFRIKRAEETKGKKIDL